MRFSSMKKRTIALILVFSILAFIGTYMVTNSSAVRLATGNYYQDASIGGMTDEELKSYDPEHYDAFSKPLNDKN